MKWDSTPENERNCQKSRERAGWREKSRRLVRRDERRHFGPGRRALSRWGHRPLWRSQALVRWGLVRCVRPQRGPVRAKAAAISRSLEPRSPCKVAVAGAAEVAWVPRLLSAGGSMGGASSAVRWPRGGASLQGGSGREAELERRAELGLRGEGVCVRTGRLLRERGADWGAIGGDSGTVRGQRRGEETCWGDGKEEPLRLRERRVLRGVRDKVEQFQGLAKVPGRAVNDEPDSQGAEWGETGPEPAAPQQWWWFWKGGGHCGGRL